jgi:hypothetical protein
MDGLIKLGYGSSQPRKTANLREAVDLAVELLSKVVESERSPTGLYNGSMPYSTHDLAVATALNVFKSAEGTRREKLLELQTRMSARMTVLK